MMLNVNVSSPVLWQTMMVQWAASFSFEGWTFPPLLSPGACLSLLHQYTASQAGRLHFWNCQLESSGGSLKPLRSHQQGFPVIITLLGLSASGVLLQSGSAIRTNPGWVKSWNIISCLLTRFPFSRNSWHIYESPSCFPHPFCFLEKCGLKGHCSEIFY